MSLATRERLYRERGIAPVIMYDFREVLDEQEGIVYLQAACKHPCPCAGWRVDDKVFYANYRIDMERVARTKTSYNPRKILRDLFRKEAKRHIDEFYRSGTMDGVPT